MVYRLGDAVKVKVLSVHLDSKQIDFEMVGSERQPRGKGKTAKKRAANADKKARTKKKVQVKAKQSGSKPFVEPTKRPDGQEMKQDGHSKVKNARKKAKLRRANRKADNPSSNN